MLPQRRLLAHGARCLLRRAALRTALSQGRADSASPVLLQAPPHGGGHARRKITDPYADGVYEHPDGSPVDITGKLTKGGVGGGSAKYARNFNKVFGGGAGGGSRSSSSGQAGDDAGRVAQDADEAAEATKLQAAFALRGPEDHRRHYDGWAQTYDEQLTEMRYVLPRVVADRFFARFVAEDGEGPLLDVGAGTGLCAARLRELLDDADSAPDGCGPAGSHVLIDGTDISPAMLHVAASKMSESGRGGHPRPVYSSVFEGNLLERLPAPDGCYSGAVSSGTFTVAHVGPEALDEVLRVVRPGGLVGVSVNEQHWAAAGFEDKFGQLEREGRIVGLSVTDEPICDSPPDDGHEAAEVGEEGDAGGDVGTIMTTARVVLFNKA